MKKLTLAVDVDEVCADLLSEWLRQYNRDYGDNLLPEDLTEWDLTSSVKPECGARIYEYLKRSSLYDFVQPLYGSRRAIYELLAMGHRVVYVTACHGFHSAQAKQEWLLQWGFLTEQNVNRDFVPATDKSLIRADILFDDRFENVRDFPGLGVMIDQPHNRKQHWHTRLPNLAAAPEFLRRLYA